MCYEINDFEGATYSRSSGGSSMTRLFVAVLRASRLFLSLAALAALAPLAAIAESYRVVEYIESTGTQYINTDISVTRNTRMVCDFQFTAVPTAAARCGWCGQGANKSVGFYFGGNTMDGNGNFGTSGTMVFAASAATTRSGYVMHTPTGTFDLDRHTFDISRSSLKFDGTQFAADNDLDYYSDNDKGHIWLFAGQKSWSLAEVGYPCCMKIFSCQIYKGKVIVRDFVPAVRTSDGAAGLYDRMSGIFFGNSGTGALIAGGEPQDVPTSLNPSSFTRSIKIRPSAGMLTSPLTNFPVLVRLSSSISGFSYETCKQDELRFALPNGTLLAHDIDMWNTNGESTVWVTIPELTSNSVFHAYWGLRPGKETPPRAFKNAWAEASYKSVWHMNVEDAATVDSACGYDATLLNANEYCGAGTGVVGGGYHNEENWNPSTSKTVMHGFSTTAIAGFSANSDTPAIATFSGWVRQIGGTCKNGFPDEETYPHIKWTSNYGNCGAIINTKNGLVYSGDGLMMCLSGRNGIVDEGYDRSKYLQVRNNSEEGVDSSQIGGELGIDSLFDKTWHHMVVRFDGSNRNLFLDGVLQDSITAPGYYGSGVKGTVAMGHRGDGQTDCVWTGDLDEFRFRSVSSSDEWLAAEYASQANPNFLTYSAVSSGNGFTIIVK